MRTVTINGTEKVAVNKTARIVTSPQEEYKPNKKLNQDIWEAPPTTHIIPVPEGKTNLVGTKRGWMIIVGYFGKNKWLAKCVCGKYEKRDGKRWKKGLKNNIEDEGCAYCQHNKHLQKRAHYLSYGYN
jgi:hypothetical protein